jgi:hypothetical protein
MRGVNIPYDTVPFFVQNTMDRGIKISWVWVSIYYGEVVTIPWVVGSKYYE